VSDPQRISFVVNYHACASSHRDQSTYQSGYGFTGSKDMIGARKLKMGRMTLTTPLWGRQFDI